MNLYFKILNKQISIINCISFIGSIFLITSIFSNFNESTLNLFFSSDTLYLPSLFKDLFVEHNSIKDWQLNPSPNFFPDMIFYFLLMLLTKHNFILSSFLFAIIQYAFMLFVFAKLFKIILPKASKNYYSIIFILLSVFLLEYLFFTKDFSYMFYFISNSYHTGCFIMMLCCVYLTLAYIQNPSYKILLVLFLISTACVISDRLFIVLYSLPAIISVFFIITKQNKNHLLFFCLSTIIATYLGLKIFKLIEEYNLLHFDNPHKLFAFDDIASSWSTFKEQITTYMSEVGFKALSIYLFIISFLVSIILYFYTLKSENKSLNFFIVFSITFSIGVIAAPILNGNYTGWDVLRYNIYPFYLTGITFALFTASIIKNKTALKIGQFITLGCSLIIFGIGIKYTNFKGLNSYINYYPKEVAVIDSLAQKEGLLCGVSNYWIAKRTTMFSRNNVKIYAVFDDLATYMHVSNQSWFYKNKFNFVILNKFNDTTSYKLNIVNPQLITNKQNIKLIKTSVFGYDINKGYLPINTSIIQ